jgi:hypothetical protein
MGRLVPRGSRDVGGIDAAWSSARPGESLLLRSMITEEKYAYRRFFLRDHGRRGLGLRGTGFLWLEGSKGPVV